MTNPDFIMSTDLILESPPALMPLTHADLVKIATRWLTGSRRCSVALAELVTHSPETPDAIGWRYQRESILVECKTSRSDFLADRKKHFRQFPDLGVGNMRFFLAPAGMIKPHELPERWGLIEPRGSIIRVVKEAERQPKTHVDHEILMLLSAIRRTAQVQPEGIIARHYAPETNANVSVCHEEIEP